MDLKHEPRQMGSGAKRLGCLSLSKNPRLSSKRPFPVEKVLRRTRRVLLVWTAQNVKRQGFREFTSRKPYFMCPQGEILICRKSRLERLFRQSGRPGVYSRPPRFYILSDGARKPLRRLWSIGPSPSDAAAGRRWNITGAVCRPY
ncbi:hypothetical protein SDC9_45962 [bioreactor metagenome]|uniref:Uncharacterized protein n=1 Tax=bioreactor metagenome TaxID=1076179 RepID=A0A644W7N0_9ZZZZ